MDNEQREKTLDEEIWERFSALDYHDKVEFLECARHLLGRHD